MRWPPFWVAPAAFAVVLLVAGAGSRLGDAARELGSALVRFAALGAGAFGLAALVLSELPAGLLRALLVAALGGALYLLGLRRAAPRSSRSCGRPPAGGHARLGRLTRAAWPSARRAARPGWSRWCDGPRVARDDRRHQPQRVVPAQQRLHAAREAHLDGRLRARSDVEGPAFGLRRRRLRPTFTASAVRRAT